MKVCTLQVPPVESFDEAPTDDELYCIIASYAIKKEFLAVKTFTLMLELNREGRLKVVRRIWELLHIPEYRKDAKWEEVKADGA